jgi:hypothetical protein
MRKSEIKSIHDRPEPTAGDDAVLEFTRVIVWDGRIIKCWRDPSDYDNVRLIRDNLYLAWHDGHEANSMVYVGRWVDA